MSDPIEELRQCNHPRIGFHTYSLVQDALEAYDAKCAEFDEEKKIVDRVWKALGISTYDQAKPLSIDDHVAKLKQQLTDLTACLEWASENVGSCWISDDESEWRVDLPHTEFFAPTLLQALTTAYENRDKTI